MCKGASLTLTLWPGFWKVGNRHREHPDVPEPSRPAMHFFGSYTEKRKGLFTVVVKLAFGKVGFI